MLILGLTGSIAMGKSTAAAHLRARGLPVFDADAEVHRLYAGGEAVDAVEQAFPGTRVGDGIDRERLSAALAAAPERFGDLERIVHPLVRQAERAFLRAAAEAGEEVAVLDIPLLYETGAYRLVDAVVVLSAPEPVQLQRLLQRGLSAEKIKGLLARQVPDAEKRARADFVIDTRGTHAETEAALDALIAALRQRTGEAYARHWAA